MTMLQLDLGLNGGFYYVSPRWFMTITNPLDIAFALDDIPLRYSNLLVNYFMVINTLFTEDNFPLRPISGENTTLPGARLAVANTTPMPRSSVLYYYLDHGGNGVYRRALYFSMFVEDVNDGVISNELRDYLETYLNEFYTNSDFILYDHLYNPLTFVRLNTKVFFKAPFRAPIRGNNSLWYNP
jgi:hypothetical protein